MGTGFPWRVPAILLAGLVSTALADTPAQDKSRDLSLETEVNRYLADATPNGAMNNDLHVFYKDGVNFETSDGMVKMKFGGRLQYDMSFYGGAMGAMDANEFRRARIYFAGEFNKNIFFKTQYEFSGSSGAVGFKDVFIGYKQDNWNVKFGHQYEQFSLQDLTSDLYLQLIERSPAVTLWSPDRNTGINVGGAFLEDKRMTANVGIFRTGTNFMGPDAWNVTARVTGIPYENPDQHILVHVGLSYSHRHEFFAGGASSMFTHTQGPSAHKGVPGSMVIGFSLAGDSMDLIDIEAAAVWKSLSVQAEFFIAKISLPSPSASPTYTSYYVEVGYWLTGEERPYSRGGGVFGRVAPKEDLGNGHWGGIQVAARYSHIDLNDSGFNGGVMDDFAAGVTWQLNRRSRVMADYVYSKVKDGVPSQHMNSFIVRWQIDW